jgi:relaxase-like protein
VIIKGKSRAGAAGLAKHLGNAETNERITLLETRGTVADDLRGALLEMEAYSAGSRCQKSLYHAALSPGLQYRLSPEQQREAFDAIEAELGLTGHSRVAILHEKLGRQHFHIVWSRIDLGTMKSVSDSHNYRKHEKAARDLERSFGHERIQGAHIERDGVKRPARTPSRSELRQEERTGIKSRRVRADVTAIFRASDNAASFAAALAERDYILAPGDRRDFVIVDHAGGIHSLARRIEDMKAEQLRQFMSTIDRNALPDIERAREIAAQRSRETEELDQSKAQGRKERSYASGADYVSQTRAALKDHQKRKKELDARADAIRMFDDESGKRQRPDASVRNDGNKPASKPKRSRIQEANAEFGKDNAASDAKLKRLQEGSAERGPDGPLSKAPGRDRTRGR